MSKKVIYTLIYTRPYIWSRIYSFLRYGSDKSYPRKEYPDLLSSLGFMPKLISHKHCGVVICDVWSFDIKAMDERILDKIVKSSYMVYYDKIQGPFDKQNLASLNKKTLSNGVLLFGL